MIRRNHGAIRAKNVMTGMEVTGWQVASHIFAGDYLQFSEVSIAVRKKECDKSTQTLVHRLLTLSQAGGLYCMKKGALC